MDEASQEISLSKNKKVLAFLRSNGWLFKPLLIIFGFVLLLVVTWIGFGIIDHDTYLYEINIALIGSLITVIVSFAVAVATFWTQVKKFKEPGKIETLSADSWKTTGIQIGTLRIPQIVIFSSSRKNTEWTSTCLVDWKPTLEYDDFPRPKISVLEEAKTINIKQAIDHAKSQI